MVKTKPQEHSGMRTPGPKKKLGLMVPPALRMPHEDLIHSPAPVSEQPQSMPSQTSQSSQPSQTRQTKLDTPNVTPTAPERDYMKTANSIVREAVMGGFFKGKSKQLYDCLYSLTRGAVVPTRIIRISRPKLMSKAHIGSRVTFDTNIKHLSTVGLIKVRPITGEHEGNEYEVFVPEELSMPSQTSQTSMPSLTSPAQKVDRLVRLETSQTRHTLSPEQSTTSSEPKTFFKTNTERSDDDDDAALAGMNAALKQAARELTGKELSPAEAARWSELAEVLITELKIAAARTTISSVPAFLAEHLRRRLWKVDKKQLEGAEKGTGLGETPSTASVDASKCPDCGGTGFYYPKGYEGGVAKCKHEKLTAGTDAT